MCGIAGIFNLNGDPVDRTLLRKMGDSLGHRGPDDSGIYVKNGLGFFHRRLSIIDLSTAGHQPMVSSDKRITIIYNGEIYNYLELREELIGKGQKFHSSSDTEVILNAYSQWGEKCLDKLNGMFSFAIWNDSTKQLFCARDRLGIKPFYYFYDGSFFVFASEIKALLHCPKVSRRGAPEPIFDFLKWGMLDHSEQTFFQSVKTLPAAHYLQISTEKFLKTRYWDFTISENIRSENNPAKLLRDNFEQAISLHLRSDVPVGFLLSGGLDSSAIVCMAKSVATKNHIPFGQSYSTFSSFFSNSRLNESEYIREVQKTADIKGHFYSPDPDQFLHDLDDLIYHQDEPFGGMSIYAQWCLMREVKKHKVKVVLNGQGADEQLGGYRKFYYFYLRELFRRKEWSLGLKETLSFISSISFLADLQLKQAVLRYFNRGNQTENYFRADFYSKFRDREMPIGFTGNLAERIKLDLTRFSLPVLLRYEDRNSMAFSVESRVPFLDLQLFEFLSSLSLSDKIQSGWTKYVLRRGLTGILPRKILLRKSKLGFQVPEDDWFRKILMGPVAETLQHAVFLKRFVNTDLLLNTFREDFGGHFSLRPASFYFRFFILEHWARVFNID